MCALAGGPMELFMFPRLCPSFSADLLGFSGEQTSLSPAHGNGSVNPSDLRMTLFVIHRVLFVPTRT